ncbi:uncharacterized protein TRIADDRAFT_18815 [Trichoplax adhaerens]|uniref:Ion transport domain-containing protein n=1 Tax=Trichoplax adhaerens TaxID=10228 RepID=B3RI48_TRIAD|nr:hypothetical protein TRIADDRAFT_18815 [Trichoplax adhaerens]EDV28391.1 hypothetical protein TRIADDRAFT_18815 [Trichoplax adhaerens]|eukprot:XP_002107593.1 hypothetical protein TRIADDRAFT_18815 [Trichoplax adhaerens]
MLFITVSVSVRKSFFGLSTLMMVLMCYALAGVVLFGNVKWGEGINRHTNFESAGQAMLVLTRIMTGEDWYKIMNNCMITTPYCTTTLENGRRISDCGNYAAAIIYFISFYVIVSFMFVNLFIAIVVENFSLFYSDEEESLLSQKNLYNFQTTWNLIDRNRKVHPFNHEHF